MSEGERLNFAPSGKIDLPEGETLFHTAVITEGYLIHSVTYYWGGPHVRVTETTTFIPF